MEPVPRIASAMLQNILLIRSRSCRISEASVQERVPRYHTRAVIPEAGVNGWVVL